VTEKKLQRKTERIYALEKQLTETKGNVFIKLFGESLLIHM